MKQIYSRSNLYIELIQKKAKTYKIQTLLITNNFHIPQYKKNHNKIIF